MDEKEILKEEETSCIPDDTDRRIMQALSDELSEIRVSKELFERTLSAVQKQKDEKKRKEGRKYRFAARMFAAAAAVLVIALGVELVQDGRGIRNKGTGMAGEDFSDNMGHTQNAGADLPLSSSSSDTKGEEDVGSADGSLWNVTDVGEGYMGEPSEEPEPAGEWLYYELLAAFDAAAAQAGGDAVSDLDGLAGESPLPQETEDGMRSISWQQEGKELSCVIYREDYRVVATLRENGAVRSLELEDWEYASRLWEMAGKQQD